MMCWDVFSVGVSKRNPDVAKLPPYVFPVLHRITRTVYFCTVIDYLYYAPTSCGFYCMVVLLLRYIVLLCDGPTLVFLYQSVQCCCTTSQSFCCLLWCHHCCVLLLFAVKHQPYDTACLTGIIHFSFHLCLSWTQKFLFIWTAGTSFCGCTAWSCVWMPVTCKDLAPKASAPTRCAKLVKHSLLCWRSCPIVYHRTLQETAQHWSLLWFDLPSLLWKASTQYSFFA